MKKLLIATLSMFVLITVLSMSTPLNPVHAQAASPAYTCDFGNGGVSNKFPCAQYIVEIAPVRLGGGIIIYQMQNPIPLNGNPDLVNLTSGSISGGASVQAFLPNSDTQTITISVQQP